MLSKRYESKYFLSYPLLCTLYNHFNIYLSTYYSVGRWIVLSSIPPKIQTNVQKGWHMIGFRY